MDQTNDIFGLDSKCSIDFQEVLKFGNEKKKVARRRWAILAKALKSPTESQPSSPTDEFSLRRISSFMLLKTQELTAVPVASSEHQYCDQIRKRTWYRYSVCINDVEFFINVGHRNRTFSAEDLMGFNNTGNVCIWPSEETLSYYVCSNLNKFRDKCVIELGGGMSCLAGLFVAKYADAKNVTVTDGNKVSVENVQATLKCNKFNVDVRCHVVKWSAFDPIERYDVILCADCIFFDDARADLIACLWSYLADNGIAFIMAPRRGNTLNQFVKQAETKGFMCKTVFRYSNVVWERRDTLLDNCDYDDNIHYPILLESVDFHEKGRRHQENVKKRLKSITKSSARAQKESENVDAAIKHMEAAAMAAYRRDVEKNSSADLTSIAIAKKLKEDNLAIQDSGKKVWQETKSKEGNIYYWNIVTNQTVWEPPLEGYSTIKEQREEQDAEAAKQLKEVDKHRRIEALQRVQEQKAEDKEERARLAREKMKERRVADDIPEPVYGPIIDPGKNDPYGRWETIKERETLDLQLPARQEQFECPVVYEPEPIAREFKEKTVESLETFGECSKFKKRKVVSGAKRNTRQRVEDD